MGTMQSVKKMKEILSRLRQKRYSLEKRSERVGKMLPASMLLRKRTKEGRFEKAEYPGKGVCAYLTYLEGGVTRHRYVRKDNLKETMIVTENYRKFSKMMAEVRSLNGEVVRVLEELGEARKAEVKKYVKKRVKGNGAKKRAKRG
ncbi:hypothetical protein FP828_09935 [bacterium]|nr:hypothetical protein [bacterium]